MATWGSWVEVRALCVFLQKLSLATKTKNSIAFFFKNIFVWKVGSSVGSDAEWPGSHSEEGTASRSNPG